MADLKEIFGASENGTLTYEQFVAKAKELGAKFADLSEDKYVSKKKYEDEVAAKDKEIETLNGTISTRDTDLADLQQKLAEAGTDAEKLTTLSNDLQTLQSKYDEDVKNYKKQLDAQAYDFAVKEYANGLEFSSEAAKRDFIQQMRGAQLKLDNGTLIGAGDFKDMYSQNNSDAFKVAAPEPTPAPTPNVPEFVAPTPGSAEQPISMTLTELMQAKNANPDLQIKFTD